jgi:hypothetical protein
MENQTKTKKKKGIALKIILIVIVAIIVIAVAFVNLTTLPRYDTDKNVIYVGAMVKSDTVDYKDESGNKGKKHRKFGAFFGRGFIINSMRKQSTGLFTVKSASTFEFRGSSPSAFTTKQKDTRRCLFILAGAEGLEPSARGFGDRCSTN